MDGPARVLTVTAVEAERDAVTGAGTAEATSGAKAGVGVGARVGARVDIGPGPGPGPGPVEIVPLPGDRALHRVRLPAPWASAPALVLDVLAAGVGPAAAAAGAATALTVAALAGTPYDLVVSAGIGGGFGLPPATAVVATAVTAADLGAQTADGFRPVTELGFGTVRHLPPPPLVRAVAGATGAVTGEVLTVSTVTGTADRAAELAALHPHAAVEAMEGFGVAEAAAAHGVPVLEVRTVSNAVGPRDREAWRIPEALRALGSTFEMMVPVLGDPASWEDGDSRA